MPSIYKEVEVEFDLTDIEDDELIEEMESRNLTPKLIDLNQIADAINLGQMLMANKLLEDLIYKHTGRIVNL